MNEENTKTDAPEEVPKVPKAEVKKPDVPEDFSYSFPLDEGMNLFSRTQRPRRIIWSVVWSDLMMTMFIMFAVMYVFRAENREFSFKKQIETKIVPETVPAPVPGKSVPSEVEMTVESKDGATSRISRKESEIIRLRHLADIGTMVLTEDKAIRIILPGDLLFDAGRSDLKRSALDTLWQVGDAIRITDYQVSVVGHTDNTPMHSEKFATNWELSATRACAVARFLIEQMKLSPTRFCVSGYAYLQPVAANDTSSNRASNRRVELVLTRNKSTKAEAAQLKTGDSP